MSKKAKKRKKDTKGKSVLTHPERMTIDKMISSGWSVEKIHNWLVSWDKPLVSTVTLRYYRNNYFDTKQILPQSEYDKRIQGLDIHFDTLQELYNLMEIQKRRVGTMLVHESKGLLMPETSDEIKILRDTFIKAIQLEMELGIREKRPIEIISEHIDLSTVLVEFMRQKKAIEEERKALEDAIKP